MKVLLYMNTIILKLWKYQIGSCAFYLVTAPIYFLEHGSIIIEGIKTLLFFSQKILKRKKQTFNF